MQSSSLNQHWYRKNIVDSPNIIVHLYLWFNWIYYPLFISLFKIHCIKANAHICIFYECSINLTTEILFFSPKLASNQNIEILLEFKNLSSVVSDLQLEIFFFNVCFFLFRHMQTFNFTLSNQKKTPLFIKIKNLIINLFNFRGHSFSIVKRYGETN